MKQKESGFTLVELLVGIAVGAIVMVTLTNVVKNYLALSQRGRYLNTANAYVEAKAESLRNKGYNAINTGSSSLAGDMPASLPKKSGTMTVTDIGGGLKKVDITVSYTDSEGSHSYSYTTYLGEIGVGQ